MRDYYILGGDGERRLVACVDSLGTAKRLTIIDEYLLDLETERGHWTLDRRAFEPAFDCCGFVGVKLPLMNSDYALYLDLRIVAALVKAGIRFGWADEKNVFVKGKEIPLFSESESWNIIRNEMQGDVWGLGQVAQLTTWVDIDGLPIPADDRYDVTEAVVFGASGNLPVAKLDTRLWLLFMLTKPESEEIIPGNPYGYMARRMSHFLAARYSHNKVLNSYFERMEGC